MQDVLLTNTAAVPARQVNIKKYFNLPSRTKLLLWKSLQVERPGKLYSPSISLQHSCWNLILLWCSWLDRQQYAYWALSSFVLVTYLTRKAWKILFMLSLFLLRRLRSFWILVISLPIASEHRKGAKEHHHLVWPYKDDMQQLIKNVVNPTSMLISRKYFSLNTHLNINHMLKHSYMHEKMLKEQKTTSANFPQ